MPVVTKTLHAGNTVRILTNSFGRQFAQIHPTTADLYNTEVTQPTNPNASGDSLESWGVDYEYILNVDLVIIDAAGIKYWGVTEKRPK